MYVCLSSLRLGLQCGTHDLQEPKMTAQSVPEGRQFIIVESKFGASSFDNGCYLGIIGVQDSGEQVMCHLVVQSPCEYGQEPALRGIVNRYSNLHICPVLFDYCLIRFHESPEFSAVGEDEKASALTWFNISVGANQRLQVISAIRFIRNNDDEGTDR